MSGKRIILIGLISGLIFSGLIFNPSSGFSQSSQRPWGIGGGINLLDFSGPLVGDYFDRDELKGVGNVFISAYLGKSFDLTLDYTFGTVFHPSVTFYPQVTDGLYDLERIHDVALLLEYKLDNGYIFREEAGFGPYIFSGIGGNHLIGDFNSYIPFGVGVKIRPAPWLGFKIYGEYNYNIDNSFDYTQAGISAVVNFGGGGKKDNDADGDGISDKFDRCPDIYGLEELYGCVDSDLDGVADPDDSCAYEAGVPENDGCPPAIDSDGDGVYDSDDKCPQVSGLKAFNGCPDTDEDGIADHEDDCPSVYGLEELNGCPDPNAPVMDDGPIDLTGPGDGQLLKSAELFFDVNSIHLSGSDLTEVYRMIEFLKRNPDRTVKISGHTCDIGSEESNVELSLDRANRVWQYLKDAGVGDNVTIYGFGEYAPKYDNDDPDERDKNRRVEIQIF